ncbi:hypothetical protein LTS08_004564 [Lithohypha guttulata]|nr:hypothetical protein LTS08_004564 [Lithohypha guttulata]
MSVVPIEHPHIALSYVWGAADSLREVLINGRLFRVRSNLYDFLCYAKNLPGAPFIWIDAICINQEDASEKNHQVREMHNIYSSAQRVVAWLGCSNNSIARFFRFLRLNTDGNEQDKKEASQEFPEYKMLKAMALRGQGLEGPPDRPRLMTSMQLLADICALEYWSRLWVVPEVSLSRDLVLMYGQEMLSAYSFQTELNTACWESFGLIRSEMESIRSSAKQVRALEGAVSEQRVLEGNQRAKELRRLLEIYGRLSCADLRDRIFALLPLSPKFEVLKDTIDYQELGHTVFINVLLADTSQDAHGTYRFQLAVQLFSCLELGSTEAPDVLAQRDISSEIEILLECDKHSCSERLSFLQQVRTTMVPALRTRHDLQDTELTPEKMLIVEDCLYRDYFVIQHDDLAETWTLLAIYKTPKRSRNGSIIPATYLLLDQPMRMKLKEAGGPVMPCMRYKEECEMIKFSLQSVSFSALMSFFKQYLRKSDD